MAHQTAEPSKAAASRGRIRVRPEESSVLEAAAEWARTMEALVQAELPDDEERLMKELERTQRALLKAVLIWQLRSR